MFGLFASCLICVLQRMKLDAAEMLMDFVVNVARTIIILRDCAKYVQLDFLVTSAKQSVHTPGMESYVGSNVTVPIVTATRLLDAKTRILEQHQREICKREHHI